MSMKSALRNRSAVVVKASAVPPKPVKAAGENRAHCAYLPWPSHASTLPAREAWGCLGAVRLSGVLPRASKGSQPLALPGSKQPLAHSKGG
jgi:hypothetical protein